jgi:hypothetical protein
MRVHELRSGFSFASESLPHVRIARQVRVHHLDHHRAIESDVERVIHVRHAALAHSMHDAVASACNVAKSGYRRIGRLRALVDRNGEQLSASKTSCG